CAFGEFVENRIERNRRLPGWIVLAKARQVADVADVIPAARALDVIRRQPLSGALFETSDGLEERDAVRAPPAGVVYSRGSRPFCKGQSGSADVVGVDVVADLFPLVSVDPVDEALTYRARDVREEAMELGSRVVSAGNTTGPERDGGHVEVAAVFLYEQV